MAIDAASSDTHLPMNRGRDSKHMDDAKPRSEFPRVLPRSGVGALTSLVAACLVLGTVSREAAADGQHKTVLELFTSQSCSSCPPADALLKKFVGEDEVIALSFPVDYWDYTGWKDTLATPENADRQQFYAQHCSVSSNRIYTPQMAVNGLALVPGGSEDRIKTEIAHTSDMLKDARVPVTINFAGNGLTVTTGDAGEGKHASGTVLLAAVTKSVEVEIRKGENAGKRVTYSNVVRQIIPLGKWTGTAAQFDVSAEKMGEKSPDLFVAMLQADDDGSILGAADIGR
jgi:hypothetical protein